MPDTQPEVSIALLTLNAGDLLERTIDALDEQVGDRSVERVALDSGSTDGTVARLERAGFRVEPYHADPFNFGSAREALYQQTRGEIIVNLSQDAVPADVRWLESLLAPFADDHVAVVCGRSVPDDARATRQFLWERNGLFYFTSEMQRFRERYGRGVSFANSAVRRKAWESHRFDPIPLGEDFQLQTKLYDSDWKIVFADDAAVLHHHAYSHQSLRARCRNEGAALRALGIPYGATDAIADTLRARVWAAWLRAAMRGDLHNTAEWLFPVIRPWSVRSGSRGAERAND